MTVDHQAVEQKAQALLKFALGNHNAKRYGEAAGFYEVILQRYSTSEAAQYARKNLESLVNKIDGLEAIPPDATLIARIEKPTTAEPAPPPAAPSPPRQPATKAATPPQDAPLTVQESQPSPDKPAWKRLRIAENPYLLAGLFFLTAVVSYFIGREHVKYEIRQVFTGAAEGFRKNMADAMTPLRNLGSSSESSSDSSKDKADQPKAFTFPVTLNEKELQKSNYIDYIAFSITIDNTLDRPIKAFEGRILFRDVLGKLVLGANMSYRDGLAAKGRTIWSGTIRYNQFMSSHKEFIDLDKDQLIPEMIIEKVAYEGGTIEEFPKH